MMMFQGEKSHGMTRPTDVRFSPRVVDIQTNEACLRCRHSEAGMNSYRLLPKSLKAQKAQKAPTAWLMESARILGQFLLAVPSAFVRAVALFTVFFFSSSHRARYHSTYSCVSHAALAVRYCSTYM